MSQSVSVVIPAYNYGRFLGEAIESVLNQTFESFELIVVDDGSSDHTRSVVSRYSDPRLRYIYQSNRGLSAARNTGIRNARFDFIAFLDADDLWLPTRLAAAMEDFSNLPREFGQVVCGSQRMTEQGALIDTCQTGGGGKTQREFRAQDIVLKSRFMPSTVVVRKEVFKTVGFFDTTLRSSEDRDMWIRVAGCCRIHCRSEPLVRIRKHENNMSRNADRMRSNMRRVLAKYFHHGNHPGGQISTLPKAYSFHYFEAAWMYYDERRICEAIGSMLVSLVLWPFFFNSPETLGKPVLFRLRGLAHFILGWGLGKGR